VQVTVGSGVSSSLSSSHYMSKPLPTSVCTSPLQGVLSCTAQPANLFGPLARQRRAPLPAQMPPVVVRESFSHYTINVYLPTIIQSDMVTIAVVKGDKMKLVADAWHLESNCACDSSLRPTLCLTAVRLGHFEWLIAFPPRAVDTSRVHAKLGQDGLLSIEVQRVCYGAHAN
jgi:hypothetical protein